MEELSSEAFDGKATITLLFFAKARELMEKSKMEIEFFKGPYTAETLHAVIMKACTALGPIAKHFVLALNEEYVDECVKLCLKTGDRIAIIPPLSGG